MTRKYLSTSGLSLHQKSLKEINQFENNKYIFNNWNSNKVGCDFNLNISFCGFGKAILIRQHNGNYDEYELPIFLKQNSVGQPIFVFIYWNILKM